MALVIKGSKNDYIETGSASDVIFAGSGNDVVSSGGGNDNVYLGSGNDTAIFVWNQNENNTNSFRGESGTDTLRIVLTAEEALDPDVQRDLAAFQSHVARGSNAPFHFSSIRLMVSDFERLEIVAPVVAEADTAMVNEDGPAVTLDVLSNDQDLLAPDQSALQIIGFDTGTIPVGATLSLNADQTFTFMPGSAFNWLAEGQQTTVTFTYTIADDQGFESVGTVTLTITGSNDAPVITSQAQSGAVTEIADGATGENTTSHSASGTVSFADVDLSDSHSASSAAQGSGYLGSFSLDPLDQGSDSVGWSFSVDDAALDYLAAGEVLTQSYEITIDDGEGGTASQIVEITITGSNDAPVITSQAQSGAVTEIADGAAGENTTSHSASGTVSFADVDLSDSHSASSAAQGSGYLGSFSLDPLDQGSDSVGWSFSVDDAALDYLATGEVLTQSYEITIDDGEGGTASQIVEITITGSNDAPVITSQAQSGAVTEIADGATGENTTSHSASGTVSFADVDLSDSHSASSAAQGSGYLGSFSLDPLDQGSDSVGWSFSVDDAALDYLAAGEVLTQSYEITIDDGEGGTASQIVEITITGSNDAPVITSQAQSGAVTEIADGATGENTTSHSASGTVSFADVDLSDSHSASSAAQGSGYLGSFSLDPLDQGSDSVGWSFSVDDAALDYLATGEVLTQSYEITIDDGEGGTASQIVEITITGSNDAPVITSQAQSGAVTEIADGATGENTTSHSASGTVSFADVDLSDSHSASSAAQGSGYLGSFSLDPLDQGSDSVGWSFSVDDAALDYLAAGEVLTQSYEITIDDGEGGTTSQIVEISITGSNDAPIVSSGVLVTNEGWAASGRLTSSDPDSTDMSTFSIVDGPQHGSVVLNPDGTYEYTPAAGYSGTDSFTFLATDQAGASSSVGTMSISVDAGGEGQVTYIATFDLNDAVSTNVISTKDNPEVAALSGGGHVVVWSSNNQAPDSGSWGVFAQRYDGAGEKVGSEFHVSTSAGYEQYDPSIAGIAGGTLDGGFVVVWQSLPQDGSGWGVYGRRYAADGTAIGGEFLVNATTANDQAEPSVTALANGQFAVTWRSQLQDGNGQGVYFRVFNDDGTAATGEILATQTTAGDQLTDGTIAETITTLDDGGFVVSWRTVAGGDWDVFARVFNADGSARSNEFQVSTGGGPDYYGSVGALAGAGAGFVVTWTDTSGADGSSYGVFARRYDADGNALGVAFQVNTFAYDVQYLSKAVGLPDGGFVVVWQSYGVDGNNWGISGQRYDADGNAIGGEFLINDLQFFSSNQIEPTIDLRADGALIVVWKTDNSRIEQKIITDFDSDTTELNFDEHVSSIGHAKDNPEVSALAGGGHIVVWSSSGQAPDSNGYGVFAQRYDASGDKIGSEFLVNSTISSNQYEPSVAGLTGGSLDGGFVVVWQSFAQDGSGWGVYGRRYASDGTAIGGEFLVNATTANDQAEPSVTALANGQFAVTWRSLLQDGSGHGVYFRIFNDDGTAATGEILVTQTTAGDQITDGTIAETITTLDDGGFVVSWRTVAGGDWDVFARVFNADGSARSNEFQVSTGGGPDYYGSVGALAGAGAGFVVTWTDTSGADGSSYGVFARRYDADGNALGVAFQVNTFAYDVQYLSKAVGLPDGGFVVVWQSYGVDGNNWGISGQRYDADGNAIGGEFLINDLQFFSSNQIEPTIDLRADGALIVVWKTDNSRIEQKIITDFDSDTTELNFDEHVSSIGHAKDNPEVSALAGGGHIVVWSSSGQAPDSNGYGVFAQRYDASGDKIGSEFLVNSTISNNQYEPSVAGLTGGSLDGGFVVVWQSFAQDGSGWGVYGRRYASDGTAIGGEFLVNATTANDQAEPSVTALANGQFAVTWRSLLQDGSGYGVYFRIFNDDGTAATGEILVTQTTAGDQWTDGFIAETITALDDGGFVVSWRSVAGGDWDVFARVFNADGSARSNEFQVSTGGGADYYGSVGALAGAGAGFVVTWTDLSGADGSSYGVFARRYDADGNALENAFQVNTFASSAQLNSKAVGLPDGGFVIVWQSSGVDGNSYGISGQRYNEDGNAIGSEFIINDLQFIGSSQIEPSVDLRADGALIVVWETDNSRIEQKIVTDFGSGADEEKSLVGSAGNDVLVGSSLGDSLDGAAGDDAIEGLGGDDLLTGGAGADQFVFASGSGNDTITDFELGVDGLVLEGGLTIASLSESDVGGSSSLDTVVELSSGDTVVLIDVNNVNDPNSLLV